MSRYQDERVRENARKAWQNICTAMAYDGCRMSVKGDWWVFSAWRKSATPRLRSKTVRMHRIEVDSMGHTGVRTFQQQIGHKFVTGIQFRVD